MGNRLNRDFYLRDALQVAPDLLGREIVIKTGDYLLYARITETEAYVGTGDMACHASKGKTKRTEVMFREGGIIYMYLVYGIHWMMNVVTSERDNPQAVLIRGITNCSGPGKLTKKLGIDKSFNGISLLTSDRIRIEKGIPPAKIITSPRIGIDYAGEPWVSKPWRFFIP